MACHNTVALQERAMEAGVFRLFFGLAIAVAANIVAAATVMEQVPTEHMLRTWTPDAATAFEQAQAASKDLEGTPQDCAMRRLAMEFALALQPERAPLREVFDALQLESLCGVPPPHEIRTPGARKSQQISVAASLPAASVYVDPNSGNDRNVGSIQHPVASIEEALERTRRVQVGERAIVLRAGLHHIRRAVELTHVDSNLTIRSFPSEDVWISGGKLLASAGGEPLQWSRYGDATQNIWKTILPVGFGDVPSLVGLLPSGKSRRQTRARHPNRVPASGSMEHGLWRPPGTVWVKPQPWPAPAKPVTVARPNDTIHHTNAAGAFWTYGVGGPCDRFDPPGSFHCSADIGPNGFPTIVKGAPLYPIGLIVNEEAFRASGVKPPSSWQSGAKTGAKPVVESWTNGWATTFWEVDAIENQQLLFGRGGNQLAWGAEVDGSNVSAPIRGGPWMIENALELLDQPEEWFYAPTTRELFLWHNVTGSPSSTNTQWIAPQLAELFRLVGSQDRPVVNITFHGLGFRDTTPEILAPRGVPSGGDWAMRRAGALFFEGVSNIVVDGCSFLDVGGNAVFLSGYTRGVTVANSSFEKIGESAIATWGHTRDLHDEIQREGPPLPKGVGIDGTDGDQPRGTRVLRNIVRDIGLYERQSSAFGEFKACQSYVAENIIFNIPRAAININDGFGGGSVLERNLLFNTCRESGDHGPFNSWDRQPYLTDVKTGRASLVPAYNTITKNFMFANYGAGLGVDNDDTSSWYNITSNVLYQGGGLKCDYSGHDKYFSQNLLVQTKFGACSHTCAYKEPFTDHCFDNTIVQMENPGTKATTPFATIWFCNATDPSRIMRDYGNQMLPNIHSNRIFNANGTSANVTCGYSGPASELLVPLERFLEVGLMKNTTVHPLPNDATLLAWARSILNLPVAETAWLQPASGPSTPSMMEGREAVTVI